MERPGVSGLVRRQKMRGGFPQQRDMAIVPRGRTHPIRHRLESDVQKVEEKQKGLLGLTSFQLTSCPSKLQPSVGPHLLLNFHDKWSPSFLSPLDSALDAFLMTRVSRIRMLKTVLSVTPLAAARSKCCKD